MKRRQFVASCATGLLAGATPLSALSANTGAKDSSWSAQYAQALQQKPWLGGYQNVASDAFDSTAHIEGKWPQGLQGTLYRNGPAQHEVFGYRYHHWFDGDGMIQAYRMGPAGVSHSGKIIKTHKYQAEQAAGRALYPGFASVPPEPKPVTSPDLINVGNISVLPHHGKLLALWEAGSPWEIDADSLDTRDIYRFSDKAAGVPFSAHPRVEANGTLWNFGYVSGAGLLVLWHINKQGKLLNMASIPSDPMSMPHDFVATSRHLVILMPPMNYQPGQAASFLDAHQWQPDQPTRVLVVDKSDFSSYRWLELPSQWVFHFGNAWEDKAGIIRFDGARADDPMSMINSFRDVMRGVETPTTPSRHYQYTIDTKNWTVAETPLLPGNVASEFPVVDPRVSCSRNRRLLMLTRADDDQAVHSSLNQISSFNIESATLTSYRYPDSQIPEEHLFVPAPGSAAETRGWVIGTSYDWQQGQTRLNVFDVEAIDAGPVAIASLPYALPLGLHGKFVAA
jgi:all-trans-8'-apo-beta-carotenal 15,15'-oxygenase